MWIREDVPLCPSEYRICTVVPMRAPNSDALKYGGQPELFSLENLKILHKKGRVLITGEQGSISTLLS